MTAVLKHELRSYFHSFTAYVFGAFLLAIVGFGAMLYNLQAAVSNFEYVLSFGSIVFVVIVPILTMRVIAEERKQKTDQLLYSLPITTTQVILGKYLALLAVYLIPLAVLVLALGALIRYLTRNEYLAYAIAFVLLAAICITGFVDPEAFEGLLPNIMRQLSLFERFNTFVSGVFDLTAIAYYLSVIVFFLFLPVQSLEKRRYH